MQHQLGGISESGRPAQLPRHSRLAKRQLTVWALQDSCENAYLQQRASVLSIPEKLRSRQHIIQHTTDLFTPCFSIALHVQYTGKFLRGLGHCLLHFDKY